MRKVSRIPMYCTVPTRAASRMARTRLPLRFQLLLTLVEQTVYFLDEHKESLGVLLYCSGHRAESYGRRLHFPSAASFLLGCNSLDGQGLFDVVGIVIVFTGIQSAPNCANSADSAERRTHHPVNERDWLLSTVIIRANMGNNPDWIFYRHDGPTEADVMPRLVAEFPGFRPRWQEHLEFWEGKPAGNYNDICQFAHFLVRDLFLNEKTDELQRAFDLMEYWLKDGSKSLQELIVIGFLEDVQNIALGQGLALDSLVPFLGPKSHEAWDKLERYWAGKGNPL